MSREHDVRPLAPEPVVPFPVEVLDADARVVVVDKPHFLATTPRGTHVRESVLVRLRDSLGLPDLAPAHRLDRLTAGVLMLPVQRGAPGRLRWPLPDTQGAQDL